MGDETLVELVVFIAELGLGTVGHIPSSAKSLDQAMLYFRAYVAAEEEKEWS